MGSTGEKPKVERKSMGFISFCKGFRGSDTYYWHRYSTATQCLVSHSQKLELSFQGLHRCTVPFDGALSYSLPTLATLPLKSKKFA